MRAYVAGKEEGKTILFYEGGDAPLVNIEEHEKEEKVQEIDMTRPQPCTKFRNAGIVDWAAKLNKEVYEVIRGAAYIERLADEADDDDVERLAEELTNVITVCTSWLDALGYDEEKRGELHRRVNEKNEERGYL